MKMQKLGPEAAKSLKQAREEQKNAKRFWFGVCRIRLQ